MSLHVIGLTPAEEELYRLLVTAGPVHREHLAELASLSTPETAAAISRLHEKGLVTTAESDRVAPAPPDVALAPLLLQGQQSLSEAGQLVTELAEEHRANARRRDAGQLVEVLTGGAAIRQALRTVQLATQQEMMWFCRAGHVAMPSSDNDEEFAMLGRGIRYRVIYEQALLEEPGMLDSLVEGVRAGEEARAVPELPVRMAISDRTIALCPLVPSGEGSSEPTAALVRDSNLLTALIALFESYWSGASPLQVGHPDPGTPPGPDAVAEPVDEAPGRALGTDRTSPATPVTHEERELLSLLVAGVTDKAIATRLGVSSRTVQRRVSDLMVLTGAQSRMQLAWQVAQRDWLAD